ncbi:MAG: alpha-ribazole phosphatase family protein [Propionibacteriaceae bacterium]|nr:alpha-ribazole phosphatase family protein [Propionibacteriaceae bacterium]
MKLWLIRHPAPLDAAGRCYGRTDLNVAAATVAATARDLRPLLPESFDAVVSSPRRRCTALAAALSDHYDLDDRLAELDFGAWEGQLWADIDRAAFDQWAADYVTRTPPGGESWSDVQQRVGQWLGELRSQPFERVAVVTHTGVIRALLSLVIELPLVSTWRIDLPFGAVVTLELGPTAEADSFVGLVAPLPTP